MKYALSGARIFDGFCFHDNAVLQIENGRIVAIADQSVVPDDYDLIQLNGGILSPGFIDLQINGAGGAQFNNAPDLSTLSTMASAMLPFGVTNILPTVITDDVTVTNRAVEVAIEAKDKVTGILGVHVEGPFFSLQKNGVHRSDKIRTPNEQDWSWLNKLATLPAILTLAPEQVDTATIERIAKLGVRICAGHTNGCYDDVINAHRAGLRGFTHLYNAMRPMTGREPGVVGAALELKDTWAGLISDGIHVHNTTMKLAIEAKGYDKIFLVSDAMATAGSDQKTFELYGETIEEMNGQLVNAEGKLAGSAITLADAVKYCAKTLALPLEQVLAMASRVPAQFMQLSDQVGTFVPGAAADICLLNDELDVQQVWQAGLSKFQR